MVNFQQKITTENGYELTVNTGLFINNEFVEGPKKLDTTNPATGEKITTIEASSEDTIDKVVDIAHKTYYKVWKTTPAKERGNLLMKLAMLVEEHAEELAQIETLDSGKCISFTRAFDVPQLVDTLKYYAGWADKIQGKVIEVEGALAYTQLEPLGVCAGIIPWNFPLVMVGWKIAPALAAGNTVIIKTSELTPLSALKVAELVKEAGFPPGTVAFVSGDKDIGESISKHGKIAKVSFTGSTAVGHSIMKCAAESNLKKVTLELGGKSPSIIFDDADLEEAVQWAHKGVFFNTGQVCCAGTRLYVQDTVYEKFIEKFKQAAEETTIGNPEDEETFLGPQISKGQLEKTLEYIEKGKEEGAKLITGGSRLDRKGFFVQPTIFADCKQDMTIMKEEIFGPVVAITKFSSTEEAIELANDTSYGLAAAVFSKDTARCIDVANKIESGTVWINCFNELDYNTPFGGYHLSGQGRENGEYALDNYTQVKTIKVNISRKP